MRKVIIALILLILISSCINVSVDTPIPDETDEEEVDTTPTDDTTDTTPEPIPYEPTVVEEPEEEKPGDNPPYYVFLEGESKNVLGSNFEVVTISTSPFAETLINGKRYVIKDTKAEEIINDLRISIQEYYFDHEATEMGDYAIFKIEKLVLEENQYLVDKGGLVTVGDRDFKLDDVKSDGWIEYSVYKTGTSDGYQGKASLAKDATTYGVTVQPVKTYWRMYQYAIVELTI